ncbi:MAG: GNAT family N-acetyltransferase [bacterium]|nr:GNAT family N-acetyltransferase [bacterium]
MSLQEPAASWTPRDGMPLSGNPALDAIHARILTQAPERADAIVWLQGNGYDRGAKVLALFRGGFAAQVAITGNRVRSPVTVDHLAGWLCERAVPVSAIVLDANAMHTRDQAVHVLALAQEYQWRTLLLVASPHHQLRAFLTFLKRAQEVGWFGRIVNQPAELPWGAVPSERRDTAAAAVILEYAKIRAYAAHVAAPADAERHLAARMSRVVTLRPATLADAATLFAWRNDPSAYQFYRTPHAVPWDAHVAWVASVLADPTRALYIVSTDGMPVGQVRFDQHADTAEITLAIAAEHRGKGLGAAALREAGAACRTAFPDVRSITAEIAEENAASLALFASAGFRAVGRRGQFVMLTRTTQSL